ncbi:MAG: zinc-ribbon domain-containing protein [Methanomassiliicoccaceae archaeon]|nr:zinc-ribbon domain-containing protein [Methanomassiliicoccaceae archaeon]
MNNAAGTKTMNLKWFGTLTLRQILGLIAAFVFALALTLVGFGYSCMCFGMLLIAVILYMLPRTFGVENIKLMTLVGVLFTAAAVLIGGFVTAPGLVDANQGDPPDNEYFIDVEYTYTAGGVEIEAVLLKDIGTGEVFFKYIAVTSIGLGMAVDIAATLDGDSMASAHMDVAGSLVSGSVSLDSDRLYLGYLMVVETDASGEESTVENSATSARFLTGAYDGDLTPLCLLGCFVGTLYITIVFFLIMVFSNFMRVRVEKTRERMEKEGRLYPQGYGRCDECGAMVLPGEVNCRKCGAYIDRPDEMKPKKKDFFECSDCGAEVPMDAKTCPKCGAVFEEDEFEVVHSDGTVEITGETFACPECGAVSPATATFCVKCGAKFGRK